MNYEVNPFVSFFSNNAVRAIKIRQFPNSKINQENDKIEERIEQESNPENVARPKRFYAMHANIGCVKGFKCCQDPKCQPFCSMCNNDGLGKPKGYICLA